MRKIVGKTDEYRLKINEKLCRFFKEKQPWKRPEFFCKIGKERLKPEKKSCKLYNICNKMKNL